MKKFVLIPDSFKGTMSSKEICKIMEEQIRIYFPNADIVSIPVADGGEGSIDAFLAAMKGEKVFVTVKGPYMQEMDSFYGVVGGDTAVIEMAACAGLPLAEYDMYPDLTTTYGVGQMIVHAAENGCKKIIVGLGGSCTNDAGAGAAAAAGVKFYDQTGKEFVPTGGTLASVSHIDISEVNKKLKNIDIIAMCDIDNPLYGKTGAAYVFGPQKGADKVMVKVLDDGLRAFSKIIEQDLHIRIAQIPGAGAAGGMGGGMKAFFGSELQMGIETVLDTVHFDSLVKNADLVISGEGKIDSQSLRGKVVLGVARRTKALGIPLIAVVGDIGDDIQSVYEEGVSAIFSTNRVAVSFEQAKRRSRSDLVLTINNLMRFFVRMQL